MMAGESAITLAAAADDLSSVRRLTGTIFIAGNLPDLFLCRRGHCRSALQDCRAKAASRARARTIPDRVSINAPSASIRDNGTVRACLFPPSFRGDARASSRNPPRRSADVMNEKMK
jgi:hypothetical protein